mgnify:CR=1 FL=1
MARSRNSPSSPSPRSAGGRSGAPQEPAAGSQATAGSNRYRRTAVAFLLLALAVVTGLREWFGVSGAAGSLLHHLAAGPVGVLGLAVPPLLGALGVTMLRVRRLDSVHARIIVGSLGILTALTGMIQVFSTWQIGRASCRERV